MIDPGKSTICLPWLAATIVAAWLVLIAWFLVAPPQPPVSLPVVIHQPPATHDQP